MPHFSSAITHTHTHTQKHTVNNESETRLSISRNVVLIFVHARRTSRSGVCRHVRAANGVVDFFVDCGCGVQLQAVAVELWSSEPQEVLLVGTQAPSFAQMIYGDGY